MGNIRVMLCCGAGMSSGFMAQRARKAAKKYGLDIAIDARSESQVNQYIGSIDLLMLGPHYSSQLPHYEKICEGQRCAVCVIPQDIYGALDGEALLRIIMEKLQIKEKQV
ncbi:PTS sugar transporter subunit IIB [Lachnospiraceae bacterium 54-53]